jgi:hypothetical protein
MSSRLIKSMTFTLAILLVTASWAIAQQSGSSTAVAPLSQRGGALDAQDTINATVAEVNYQQKTIRLRTQGGETVELKVPEQSLSNLKQGDSVQVSIRKAEAQAGTSSMQQSQPGAGTPSGPATAPRSHQ